MNTTIFDINENQFICPILQDYFTDPVLAADGHMYEKSGIEKWFETKNTSPVTGSIICKTLLTNYMFNNILKEFYKKNPDKVPYNIDILIQSIDDETYTVDKVAKYLDVLYNTNMDRNNKIYERNSDKITEKMYYVFSNEKFVDFLIANYPKDYVSENNWQMIHYICKFSTIDIVTKYVNNPDNAVHLELETTAKSKPIHMICGKTNLKNNDKLQVIKLFLDKGVSVNEENEAGFYPIHIICSNKTNLTNEFQLDGIKLLLDSNVDLEVESSMKWRPIHYICSNKTNLNDEYQLNAIKLFLDKNVDLECSNDKQMRPIHYICSNYTNLNNEHQVNAIKLFLDKNVNIDVSDDDNWYPIHYICSSSTNLKNEYQLNVIKLFLEKDARLDHNGEEMWKPIHYLCSQYTNMTDQYLFEALKLFLDKNIRLDDGVANYSNKYWTPIHFACSNEIKLTNEYNVNFVKLLIEKGAKLNESVRNGYYPIHFSCTNHDNNLSTEHQFELIQLLIDNGCNIQKETKNDDEPIMIAYKSRSKNYLQLIRFILDKIEQKENAYNNN